MLYVGTFSLDFLYLAIEVLLIFREELKSILNQAGITSIFVTHDREDVKSIADKVVILKGGEFVKAGNLEEAL